MTLPSNGLAFREKGPTHGTFVTTGRVQYRSLLDWAGVPLGSRSLDEISNPCWCRPGFASTGTVIVIGTTLDSLGGSMISEGTDIHSSESVPNVVQSISILTGSSES